VSCYINISAMLGFRVDTKIDVEFSLRRPGTRLGAHSRLRACPPRASPPAAARRPTEGYFTRASTSAAVPGAQPSQSGAPGLAFSRFFAESPGCAFAPLSATGLGFGKAGTAPGNSFYLMRGNAREYTRTRAFTPRRGVIHPKP